MSRRVLVTRARGFRVRYLVEKLFELDFEVWCLNCEKFSDLCTYKIINEDLTHPDSFEAAIKSGKPNYVIHLAGIAFVAHSSPSAFHNVNLIGTLYLLQALASHAHDLKCVLLASSANVYGYSNEDLLAEAVLPRPAKDYAVSKRAMENMALLWLSKQQIVIARPLNYTGIGQVRKFLIPKIVSHFLMKKSLVELVNLGIWREFNDVRDVSYAYAELIEAEPV